VAWSPWLTAALHLYRPRLGYRNANYVIVAKPNEVLQQKTRDVQHARSGVRRTNLRVRIITDVLAALTPAQFIKDMTRTRFALLVWRVRRLEEHFDCEKNTISSRFRWSVRIIVGKGMPTRKENPSAQG